MSTEVGRKATRGALITLIGGVPFQLLTAALTLLTARCLTPADYGQYSLAFSIYGVSAMLSNPAFPTYVVRNPRCSDDTIDAAWTLSALRGLLLFSLFWALAPLLSLAFGGDDQVTFLLRILACGFLLNGLRNLHVLRYQHQLRFGLVLVLDGVGTVVGAVASIVLLLLWRDALALAIGTTAGAAANGLMSWIAGPRRARARFDRAEYARMWAFTRHLLLNNVILYALKNLDNLVVAKLAGTAALGLYAMSYNLVNTTVMFVIRPLSNVLLPAMARVADDRERFTRATLSVVSAFAAIAWIITSWGWVYAPELFVVLGGRSTGWESATPIFRALLPFVLVRAINNALSAMVTAAGEPHHLNVVSGAQLALMVPLAVVGFHLYGFIGLSITISVLAAGTMLALMVLARRFIAASSVELLAQTVAPMPAAVGAALAALLATSSFDGAVLRLLVGAAIALPVFAAAWEGTCRLPLPFLRHASSTTTILRATTRRSPPAVVAAAPAP